MKPPQQTDLFGADEPDEWRVTIERHGRRATLVYVDHAATLTLGGTELTKSISGPFAAIGWAVSEMEGLR